MVKITLEFPTVDLAIVALGKLVSAGRAAVTAAPPQEVPASLAETTAPRKGRSDKGVPRKDKVAMVQAEQKDAEASSETTPSPSPVRPVPEPTTPAPVEDKPATLEAAQAALTELFNAKGASTAMDLLARYGKSRLSEVPAEDRQRLIDDAKGLLNG